MTGDGNTKRKSPKSPRLIWDQIRNAGEKGIREIDIIHETGYSKPQVERYLRDFEKARVIIPDRQVGKILYRRNPLVLDLKITSGWGGKTWKKGIVVKVTKQHGYGEVLEKHAAEYAGPSASDYIRWDLMRLQDIAWTLAGMMDWAVKAAINQYVYMLWSLTKMDDKDEVRRILELFFKCELYSVPRLSQVALDVWENRNRIKFEEVRDIFYGDEEQDTTTGKIIHVPGGRLGSIRNPWKEPEGPPPETE